MSDIALVKKIHQTCLRLDLPVATAESCTAGLLASTLTCCPGTSKVYAGGAVTYSALLKHRLLGVSLDILDTGRGGPGEVSEACALAMAKGILHTSGVLDVGQPELRVEMTKDASRGMALSTTGFLQGGPEGRDGEVWIGCHWTYNGKEDCRAKQMWMKEEAVEKTSNTEEERSKLKEYVVREALKMALEVIEELEKEVRPNDKKRS